MCKYVYNIKLIQPVLDTYSKINNLDNTKFQRFSQKVVCAAREYNMNNISFRELYNYEMYRVGYVFVSCGSVEEAA